MSRFRRSQRADCPGAESGTDIAVIRDKATNECPDYAPINTADAD